jgi:ABC-type uncharacterized transport system permease subunit
MRTIVKAAVTYFSGVFLAGFVLGFLRVFVIVPRIGALRAVALELPIMVAVSWTVCGWVLRRFAPGAGLGVRAAIGLLAFVLLMVAEAILAMATGGTLTSVLASLATPEGALGLSGQGIFALIPLLHGEKKTRL